MTPLKQPYSLTNWDLKYLGLAYYISQWSKDPTTKVGCVISNIHDICIGMGFNGGPKGTLDSKGVLEDREKKRLRTVHAEMNAIHFSTGNIRGSTFYTTHTPCCPCAANIIQRDPRRVISLTGPTGLGVDWGKSTEEASLLFKEAGIDLVIVSNDDVLKLGFDTPVPTPYKSPPLETSGPITWGQGWY